MGDRFYEQRDKFKPKRVLKKDIIAEINEILSVEMLGLDKCTIATLTQLTEAIENALLK